MRLILGAGPDTLGGYLDGYDANGARVARGRFVASVVERGLSDSDLPEERVAHPTEAVSLSNEASAMFRFDRSDRSSTIPASFFRPDREEPLDIALSEALAPIAAEFPQRAVVYALSDRTWMDAMPSSAWERVGQGETVTIDDASLGGSVSRVLRADIATTPLGGDQTASDWNRLLPELISESSPSDIRITLKPLENPVLEQQAYDGAVKALVWRGDMTLGEFSEKVMPVPFRLINGVPTPIGTRALYENAFGRLRYCHRDGFSIRVDLPHGFWLEGQVRGHVIPTSEPFSYQELPASIRDAVWKSAYTRIRIRPGVLAGGERNGCSRKDAATLN